MMKKYLLIPFLILTFSQITFSQIRNLGFLLGTTYYNGDYNKFTPFNLPSFAGGAIYVHDLNRFTSMRIQADFHLLKGPSNQPFTNKLFNGGLLFEYNFVPFSTFKSRRYFNNTPYLVIGGMFLFVPGTKSTVNMSIPAGIGFKYALTELATISIEWRYSLTNTDILDEPNNDVNNEKKSFKLTNDYFAFLGLTLRYNVFYEDVRCAAYR